MLHVLAQSSEHKVCGRTLSEPENGKVDSISSPRGCLRTANQREKGGSSSPVLLATKSPLLYFSDHDMEAVIGNALSEQNIVMLAKADPVMLAKADTDPPQIPASLAPVLPVHTADTYL